MRAKLCPWVVIAAGIVGVGTAHGEGKPANAVGGIVAIGGSAPERDRDVVRTAVATTARRAGWWLPPTPLTKPDIDGLINCSAPAEPWKCFPGEIDAQGIHYALVVAVEPKQSKSGIPMVVLTGTAIATSPTALVVHQRLCEHCADDKLAQASADLAVELLNELASRARRTLLEVKSLPPGAIVAVDGQPTGATDDTFNTFPGPHVVTIEKPGFLPETFKIDATEGKTVEVSTTLRPRPARLVPATLVGVGAVLAVGGTLIYLDQQDGADDKYRHSRATLIGIPVGVIGLVAIGTGVYMWRRGSAASTPSVATPTVSVAPGGALLGWMGTF